MRNCGEEEYGFLGRFRAEFPSQVIIDATDVCNLACVHCPHSQFVKTEYYSACFLDPVLSRKAVDEVREYGSGITDYIRFTGEGEPFLHRRLIDMLAYAVDRSGTTVTLTTNGALMNERVVDGLVETGVHMVDISIDAFKPETYAKIRVKGNLEVTRANVLNLIRQTRRKCPQMKVVVSFIEQEGNRDETDDFRSFWEDHGAHYVVVRRQHSGAGMIEDLAAEMREKTSGQGRRPCTYPWERIILNPRGRLSFCPADWKHGSTVADYGETTIKDVWTGPALAAVRRAHLMNDFSELAVCGQCPDWSATRWPTEGRSYADMVQEFRDGR
jgi:MoaA/NifB/PqqE/SkfB family radical SAM enzyme